jgi:hypothetical protein
MVSQQKTTMQYCFANTKALSFCQQKSFYAKRKVKLRNAILLYQHRMEYATKCKIVFASRKVIYFTEMQ